MPSSSSWYSMALSEWPAQKGPRAHPPELPFDMWQLGVWKDKLAFGYDVQHHSERSESSDHVEKRHRVLNGQTLLSCSKVEEADQQ